MSHGNSGPQVAWRPALCGAGSLLALLLITGCGAAAQQVTPIDASELATALDARKGKVVLVNFWATWCGPCLKEIPDLMALEGELAADGFELVPVSLDDPGTLDETIKPFLTKWFPGFSTYLSLENDMDTMVSVIDSAWDQVLPTSYVLDRDGRVAARIQGGSSAEQFAAAIHEVL